MQHVFSAQLGVSLRFSSQLEEIADEIFQKPETRNFFGNQPNLTPDKKAFFLNNKNNNLSLVYLQVPPIPQNIKNTIAFPDGITFSIQNEIDDTDWVNDYDKLQDLFINCVNIIKEKLHVDVKKVGSVFINTQTNINAATYLSSNFVNPFLNDTFIGGNFRFVYAHSLEEFPNDPFNISVTFNADTPNTLIITSDINSHPVASLSPISIVNILNYSKHFMIDDFIFKIMNKGE